MILIPHSREAGLFSQINFVLTQINSLGHTNFHVDWSHGTPYDQSDGRNVFDLLFFQKTPKDSTDQQRMSQWPHLRFTGGEADKLYLGDSRWRWDLQECWDMLTVRHDLLAEVDKLCGTWTEPVTAMHIRNAKIGTECPDGHAPTLEEYAKCLKNVSGNVFLATDNHEAVGYFQKLLGTRLITREMERAPDMSQEFHLNFRQSIRDVQNCLIDALCMARCTHLIHSVSNIATAVLSLNPEMSHTYLRKGEPLNFPPAVKDECRSLIRRTVQLEEPERLFHFTNQKWRDWICVYRDNVIKRHTEGSAGCFRPLLNGDLEVDWLEGAKEIYRPCTLPQSGTAARTKGSGIYFTLRKERKLVVQLKHGFANQLFCHAFGLAVARRWNAVLLHVHLGDRPYGLAAYGVELCENPPKREHEIVWHEDYEAGVEEEIMVDVAESDYDELWLEGYFQNEKFFLSVAEEVRNRFLKPAKLPEYAEGQVSVAVHVRLGDFVTSPHHAPLPPSYYHEAVALMRKKFGSPVFLVFSDDPGLAESFLPDGEDIRILPAMDEFEAFSLMQACSAFIIANSTFSWWAAWLSDSASVIAPNRFLPGRPWNVCPLRWTQLTIKEFWVNS